MSKSAINRFRYIAVVLLVFGAGRLFAFPREMMIAGIKGPWELTVNFGTMDSGFSFPVKVDNEDAQQTLDQTFPVVGSPIRVKLLHYIPDLEWKTTVVEDPKGGPVATLLIEGKGAQQEVLLAADVPERRAVTASIGGLAIRQICHSSEVRTLLDKLAKEKALGLLTVWADSNEPKQFVVKKGDSFKIPGTSYAAEILDYMPHYSIDRETKKVTNYSDKPVNPAIDVRLSDSRHDYEQWIWSNFSASPHMMSKFPIRVEFEDFDFGPSGNRYFVVTSGDAQTWLCSMDGNDIKVEPAKMQHPYSFKNDEFMFSIESILPHGAFSRVWSNDSDRLEHPALVVSVESDKGVEETVVELNKPAHVKSGYGSLILTYHQKAQPKEHGTP